MKLTATLKVVAKDCSKAEMSTSCTDVTKLISEHSRSSNEMLGLASTCCSSPSIIVAENPTGVQEPNISPESVLAAATKDQSKYPKNVLLPSKNTARYNQSLDIVQTMLRIMTEDEDSRPSHHDWEEMLKYNFENKQRGPWSYAVQRSAECAPVAPKRRSSTSTSTAASGSCSKVEAESSTHTPVHQDVRRLRRSSSARTFNEEEQNKFSPGHLPRRRNTSSLRDVQPKVPKRRQSSLHGGTIVGLEEQATFGLNDGTELTRPLDEDSSIVSGITNPTGVLWYDEIQSIGTENSRLFDTPSISEEKPCRAASSQLALSRPSPSSRIIDASHNITDEISTKSDDSSSTRCYNAQSFSEYRHQRARYPIMFSSPECQLRSRFSRFSSDTGTSKHHVSFDNVQVRHYERILEENPSTSSGPSIGIGWRYIQDSPKRIDHMEGSKKGAKELVIPRRIREGLLRELGYSDHEIAQSVRRVLKAKNQRLQTYNNLHVQTIEYLVEKSRRKVGKLLRFGPPKR